MGSEPNQLEQEKLRAEIKKLRAEVRHLRAEAFKFKVESRWFPFVAVAGVFGAAFAAAKLLH